MSLKTRLKYGIIGIGLVVAGYASFSHYNMKIEYDKLIENMPYKVKRVQEISSNLADLATIIRACEDIEKQDTKKASTCKTLTEVTTNLLAENHELVQQQEVREYIQKLDELEYNYPRNAILIFTGVGIALTGLSYAMSSKETVQQHKEVLQQS